MHFTSFSMLGAHGSLSVFLVLNLGCPRCRWPPLLHCEVSSDRTHEPNPTTSLPRGYKLLNGLTWVLLIPLPFHTGQADQGHGKPHQFHLEAQPRPRTHPSTAVPQATLLCGRLSQPLLKAPYLLSPSPVLKGPRGFPAHAK